MEAVSFRRIATVKQLQLEYTHRCVARILEKGVLSGE